MPETTPCDRLRPTEPGPLSSSRLPGVRPTTAALKNSPNDRALLASESAPRFVGLLFVTVRGVTIGAPVVKVCVTAAAGDAESGRGPAPRTSWPDVLTASHVAFTLRCSPGAKAGHDERTSPAACAAEIVTAGLREGREALRPET